MEIKSLPSEKSRVSGPRLKGLAVSKRRDEGKLNSHTYSETEEKKKTPKETETFQRGRGDRILRTRTA